MENLKKQYMDLCISVNDQMNVFGYRATRLKIYGHVQMGYTWPNARRYVGDVHMDTWHCSSETVGQSGAVR
jgi:hypothetical protein